MSSDTEHYANPETLAGALQRGLGRGADRAMTDPDGPELVAACLRRDYRWDWQVDERDVYLARLVRDLGMPIAPIIAQLRGAPPDESDDDNVFAVTLGALDVLARAGVDGVVEEVRRYIREGDRWLEALATVAATWPTGWWEDLYPAIADRIDARTDEALWSSPPWTAWAHRDERIATAVQAAKHRPRPRRPFADEPTAALLALLREPDRSDDWRPALRELRRRPPEPGILDLVEDLAASKAAGSLPGVIDPLGALALPAARRWIQTPGHPLTWTGLRLLAAHGDAADAPAVVAGLDWLDARPGDRCGYDDLAGGLARIGGRTVAAALPRLHRLWFSPHSYERAAYLRALVTLDPVGARRKVTEGLWDCESDVRLLAAQQTPLTERIRERLRYLRDDPVETAEVRAAATARLA